jgi:hypothetical protein
MAARAAAVLNEDHPPEVTTMRRLLAASLLVAQIPLATAALVTDPNDGRSWQGATVGTFAALYYGSDTLANRQQVVDNGLLDDSLFPTTGYITAAMIQATGVSSSGTSLDLTGTGSYGYTQPSALGILGAGSGIDEHWVQTDNVIGHAIWDLGFQANKAAVFNTIDHGPLPGEAIESTVYLSNDKISWTVAVVERVWLEGFMSNTGILWDGFAYAVGTGTASTFRYASVIHGGPGALLADGDNEINGIMGLRDDFTPNPTPEPGSLALVAIALGGVAAVRRRRI